MGPWTKETPLREHTLSPSSGRFMRISMIDENQKKDMKWHEHILSIVDVYDCRSCHDRYHGDPRYLQKYHIFPQINPWGPWAFHANVSVGNTFHVNLIVTLHRPCQTGVGRLLSTTNSWFSWSICLVSRGYILSLLFSSNLMIGFKAGSVVTEFGGSSNLSILFEGYPLVVSHN